ncbi:NAD(P)/FAD-dependent oxidoreductase [Chryseosolibacter indicus]|uniref:FAD-binding protein n=1 Tax=Chryseosolibacter indicus TaxID=2782351 RepID=A0ABS5VR93_9BACT|nr:FAD-dependent oxidoreductase [Chryseosolibacter indicus]MBT1703279.1 FAD-binding protein [Chryseosolibacter indicus]
MHLTELTLWPEEAFNEELFPAILYKKLGLPNDGSVVVNPVKRSIDARGKKVCVRFQCEVYDIKDNVPVKNSFDYRDVSNKPRVIVIGSGPAGLFAGLRLIELGYKPVILERGKDVQARRRDLAAINKAHIVNPDSNYCFGEGGAGTYSDGKLYTRSKKRGDINRILEKMVSQGAKSDILFDAHPHIGTNKLPKLVAALRETIINYGGEVHFDCRVTDLIVENDIVTAVLTRNGNKVEGEAFILATGHSARDIFELLHRKKILIEQKPFALGVRVEHSQTLIDQIQYHCAIDRGPYLPASSYALVHQASVRGKERGVFSFCMCPGGFIVPAATAPGEVVVNGMSPSRRDSKYANSGIVVAVEPEDFQAYKDHGPLAALRFQEEIERRACTAAGGTQVAPGQRLVDFVEGKVSKTLLETSYQPGLASVDLREVLPDFISNALQQGFKAFGKKMRGYFTNEAQIVGVESRTSSPVRIPRDKETLQHPQIKNLFPCGEGAGYAGGIVSAAMDGERCAEAVTKIVKTV